jgi:hypothetical protein
VSGARSAASGRIPPHPDRSPARGEGERARALGRLQTIVGSQVFCNLLQSVMRNLLPSPLAGEGLGVRGPRCAVDHTSPLSPEIGPARRTKEFWSAGSTWSTVFSGAPALPPNGAAGDLYRVSSQSCVPATHAGAGRALRFLFKRCPDLCPDLIWNSGRHATGAFARARRVESRICSCRLSAAVGSVAAPWDQFLRVTFSVCQLPSETK